MDFHVYYDALDFLRHRWTLEIIAALEDGPKRFSELDRSIDPSMSSKALTQALRRLVDQGLVSHPNDGDGLRYALTDHGQRVMPSIESMIKNLRWWDESREQSQSVVRPD